MEAEHVSLSCILVDACGDPIAQVAYRCSLCKKICDSTTDAMLHYQVEHVDLFAYHMLQQQSQSQVQQQQQQSQSHVQQQQLQHKRQPNLASGSNKNNFNSSVTNSQRQSLRQSCSMPARHNQQQHKSTSLLKRPSTSSGSQLKRPATASTNSNTSAGLLKRATSVMRNYQSSTSVDSQAATRATSKRPSALPSSNSASKLDTIHRQYATTSASRAAKRNVNTIGCTTTTTTSPQNHNAAVTINQSTSSSQSQPSDSDTRLSTASTVSASTSTNSTSTPKTVDHNESSSQATTILPSDSPQASKVKGTDGGGGPGNVKSPVISGKDSYSKSYSLRPRRQGRNKNSRLSD